MAVAVALDNMQNSEILGTIAGDDTVFCVVRTHNQAAVIIEKLYRIIIVPKGGGTLYAGTSAHQKCGAD